MGVKEKLLNLIYQRLNSKNLIACKNGIKLYKEVLTDAQGNIVETLRSFKDLTSFKTVQKTIREAKTPIRTNLGSCESVYKRSVDSVNHITGEKAHCSYGKSKLLNEGYPATSMNFRNPKIFGAVSVELTPRATVEEWYNRNGSFYKLPSIDGEALVHQAQDELRIKMGNERVFRPFEDSISSVVWRGF